MLFKRKRQGALQTEVERLGRQVERLAERIDEMERARQREDQEKASLSRTMNEWVYGKEGDDGE